MKVSAPQFMSSSAPPPPPDAAAPTPETPADPGAPPPPDTPAEPPKPATWPEWFVGADNALIVMALLLAFLLGSFAARNTDVFRHLATGQRLVGGTYSLGGDPLSYTGTDRPWVNQSWLFDLTVYAAHSVDNTGAVAVVLKAVVFAAAFGVLLWFRRPGQAGWPWAVLTAAGAVTAAGTANLRPIVFGTLFCSLLLLAVFRGDWSTAGRKRALLAVGAVGWLWGGFDPFAILAPVLVLVIALGAAIQRALTAGPPAADAEPSAEPKVLLLAALAALAGVLLNPTVVIGLTKSAGVTLAQIVPPELSFGTAAALSEDPDFRSMTFTLLTPKYWELDSFGLNAGGGGLLLLVLVGAVALALGVGRLSGGWLAVWIALLLLCFLANYRFLPLFAVAAVPLVGGLLNGLSERVRLGTVADRRTRGVLAASRLGRIVTVPAFLVLLACTVPGWLHPQFADPAFARRVEWRLAPDEAAVRGLVKLQQWRAEDDLPSDARGLYVSPELGDYAAWFAPAERVSINTRYRFHAAELGDLIDVRRTLLYPPRDEKAPPPPPVGPALDRLSAEYLVLGRPNAATNTAALVAGLLELTGERNAASPQLLLEAVWHLDGRTAVVGRLTPTYRHAKLSLDPARQAFAPQPGLPDGPLFLPDADAGWLAKVLLPPPQPAAFRDDGVILAGLAEQTGLIENQKRALVRGGLQIAVGGGWARPNLPPTEAELALPLLVCRAARQTVHQTHKDPSGYALLGGAHKSPLLPEVEPQESLRQRLAGYARAAARLIPPERATAAQRDGAAAVLRELFAAQLEANQLDLARDTVKELRKVHQAAEAANGGLPEPPGGLLWQAAFFGMERLAPTYRRVMGQDLPTGKGEFDFEEQVKKGGRKEPPATAALLRQLDDAVSAVVAHQNELWDRGTRPLPPGQRAILAWRGFGLAKAARDRLAEKWGQRTDPADVPQVDQVFALVALELETGQVEQADARLANVDEVLPAAAGDARAALTRLKLWKLRLQGNYREARTVLDEAQAGRFPRLTDREKQLAANPTGVMALVGVAAPPFGAPELLPAFQIPPGVTRQDELEKLAVAFQKAHLATHPILAGGQPLRDRLLGEAQYYYQRGILCLLDGDMPAAAESFRQALAPQGVPLGLPLAISQEVRLRGGDGRDLDQALFPSLQLLPEYLRLIEKNKNAVTVR